MPIIKTELRGPSFWRPLLLFIVVVATIALGAVMAGLTPERLASQPQPDAENPHTRTTAEAPAPQKPAPRKIIATTMGIGLNGIADWSTQLPFIDLMKQARAWQDWRKPGAPSDGFETDAHDWITALKPGQTAGTVFWVAPSDLPERYREFVVLYEGKGKLEYRWATQKIDAESRPGRDRIRVDTGNNLLEITALDAQDPLRNLRIIPLHWEAAFLNGDIFNPEWLARLSAFDTLRTMDWTGTNNSIQAEWAARPKPEDRSFAPVGVPWELVIALAKAHRGNLWINLPHQANDDYILQLARLMASELPSETRLYVEHSNEVWNWQFKQAHYASEKGKDVVGNHADAYMEWHGLRTAQLCETFAATALQPRLECVIGVQTGWQGLELAALECPRMVKRRQSPKPCYQRGFDQLAITTYFDGGLNGSHPSHPLPELDKTLVTWANEGPAGLDKAFTQLTTGTLLEGMLATAYPGFAQSIKASLGYWQDQAKRYGLHLAAYEGGQHITANGHSLQDNEAIMALHHAVNRDPRMGEFYRQLLDQWAAANGGLHVFFVDISGSSKWGSWGALETLWQADSPKWAAMNSWAKAHPRPSTSPPSPATANQMDLP